MTKLSLAFLAGVLMMAGVVYFAGARFAAPMFVAGVLTVVVPAIAFLSSVSRIRAAARFLSAFASGLEGRTLRPMAVPDRSGYVKPSRKAQLQNMADAVEEYRARSSKPGAGRSEATDNVLREMFAEERSA